jgi:hypothetical protein
MDRNYPVRNLDEQGDLTLEIGLEAAWDRVKHVPEYSSDKRF